MVELKRVLVVDDNRDSANCLRVLLSKSGCSVQTAYDGLAAVEMAAQFSPDVILLDIGLPKLSGYEACRRIRALPDGGRATIIAITGWGECDDHERSYDAGFTHHLVKPVDLISLEKLLEQTS